MTAQAPPLSDVTRLELRDASRRLASQPMVIEEQDPEAFRLIKRHSHQLDRWFTRRFGYRLQVTPDTARLFKSTVSSTRRPLLTASTAKRPFSVQEYTMLALTLAAVVAGPNVISLHDLINRIRSAAAEAEISIGVEPSDRRALVTALRWMISRGLVSEMHDRIDSYVSDSEADAVLKVRPDRVALLPLPGLARSETVEQLHERDDQRRSLRSWLRSMLLEEPVLYRADLTDEEWAELRRRVNQESEVFEEMFGMQIEARAEGIVAIDPENKMTDSHFPGNGTVAHAALLLIDRLAARGQNPFAKHTITTAMADLVREHRRYWSQRADDPDNLTEDVLKLLRDHRLVQITDGAVWLLPASWRYSAQVKIEQTSLL